MKKWDKIGQDKAYQDVQVAYQASHGRYSDKWNKAGSNLPNMPKSNERVCYKNLSRKG